MNASARPHTNTLYDAIESLPPGYTGEIVGGQLHVNPRPSARHVRVNSRLGSSLESPFDQGLGGPGGWWILDEPEVHLVRDVEVCVPDIVGWRRERMPVLPDDHRFEIVPDWICEILSPRTATFDRGEKLSTYARFGVAWSWIVDPGACSVEAFENVAGGWKAVGRCGGADEIRLPPFDAVAIPPPWC